MSLDCPVCSRVCADDEEFCLRCRTPLGNPVEPVATASPDVEPRSVGALLGLGIFFFPLLCGWLVWRRGHSPLARTLTTLWMLAAVCLGGGARLYADTYVRTQLQDVCRKAESIDCACFEARLAGRRLDDSDESLEAVRAAMRGCFDTQRVRAHFLAGCVSRARDAALCSCAFDRYAQRFGREGVFDYLQEKGSGPRSAEFVEVVEECVTGARAGGVPTAAQPPQAATGQAAPPPTVPREWEATSADGHATLSQAGHDGVCTVGCAVDDVKRWSFERPCEDDARDLHFVAADCGRWAVFYSRPQPGELLSTRYISVFEGPKLGWHVVGAGLVKDLDAAKSRAHLVAGLGGLAGEPPRYSSDGKKVEFTTIERSAQAVPLHADAPPPPAKTKKRRK